MYYPHSTNSCITFYVFIHMSYIIDDWKDKDFIADWCGEVNLRDETIRFTVYAESEMEIRTRARKYICLITNFIEKFESGKYSHNGETIHVAEYDGVSKMAYKALSIINKRKIGREEEQQETRLQQFFKYSTLSLCGSEEDIDKVRGYFDRIYDGLYGNIKERIDKVYNHMNKEHERLRNEILETVSKRIEGAEGHIEYLNAESAKVIQHMKTVYQSQLDTIKEENDRMRKDMNEYRDYEKGIVQHLRNLIMQREEAHRNELNSMKLEVDRMKKICQDAIISEQRTQEVLRESIVRRASVLPPSVTERHLDISHSIPPSTCVGAIEPTAPPMHKIDREETKEESDSHDSGGQISSDEVIVEPRRRSRRLFRFRR